MAEINNIRIAGPVTWYQNWAPQAGKESWGGTLALRVALPADQIHFPETNNLVTPIGQELFVQVKYRQEDAGSPRMNYITKVLESGTKSICIKDGRIVRKTKKDGTENIFLQTKLNDIQVSDSPTGIGALNSAHLHGKVVKVHKDWVQIMTKTRNPKTGEWKEHFHTTLFAGSCNAAPAEGKYALVIGRVATEAENGQKIVYLAANDAFVF